ncbi:MAG: Eco57I restriction-modification methylase domain-containing protein [Treponema sp.]|nr:Eco57I restriction-modification methylase domain-containing protein [Treponema sp.]
MSITFIKAKKALNTAFFKLPVLESEIQKLSKNLGIYINSAKDGESEEYHKGLIKDFFANTWYAPDYSVNTNGREDLVIFNGNDTASKPAVIIEAKSPTNTAEMFSASNQNCKALQECVYYFLQENLKFGNNEIKHIIITNYEDFYIFDAKDFYRFFLAKTNPIVDQFNKFEAKQLADTKTSFFYENCAKPAIEKWIDCENISVTKVTPKTFVEQDEESLIPLYKIFSPEHLLRCPFANDSNSLDRNFYAEFLHIIGLEEIKDGSKKLIQRKSAENRDSASLIESAIYQLEEEISNEEKCFETALHLVITWVNRLLFLKLVESQQAAYQKGNEDYKFLTEKLVPDFDELNILFFKVLGRKIENRDKEVREKYKFVPYLNSSLFEISEEESQLQIRGIKNRPIKLYSQTVLKDEKGKRLVGTLDNLAYIFRFLDAYNFSSDSAGGITQSSKTLINASVLGLIFEKINGYKDGSFFTPGFITEYMAKETVERAVIQKFNDIKGWKCKNLDELADEIDDREEANEIFNSIRICDPAVGSGHFLVSVLNRLLFIKSYLNILLDKNGKRIKRGDWELRLENDEISILDEDGNPFVYTTNSERQRVQETIFAEKRAIIENCLFGVDINPASVYICRLRLWIELLKNAYYTEESGYTQLETLPNIDINIKCGNSLVSKYVVRTGSSVMEQVKNDETKSGEFKKLVNEYKKAVLQYKNENNKETKRAVDEAIRKVKTQIRGVIQYDLFDDELNEKARKEDIFKGSLEWMFEFPEVLDDDGRFIGFDAVIGNPPYGIFNKKQNQKVSLNTSDGIIDLIRERYAEADEGMINAAKVFYALGFRLMSKKGYLCMIIPFGILADTSSVKIRNAIFKNHSFLRIDVFPERDSTSRRVFEDAKMSTAILLSSNEKQETKTSVGLTFEKHIPKNRAAFSVQDITEFSSEMMQIPMCDRGTFDLLMKMRSRSDLMKFGEIAPSIEGEIHMTKCKPAITSDSSKDSFLKGAQIAKWYYKTDISEISQGEIEFIDSEKLKSVCSAEKISNASRERIVFQRLTGINEKYRLKATMIPSGIFIANSVNNLTYQTSYPAKLLLALFNSKLLNSIFKATSTSSNVNGYEVDALPLPQLSEENSELQQQIISLVDEILAAKKANHNADTTALEAEIDRLVYALYDLTDNEIKFIEGK